MKKLFAFALSSLIAMTSMAALTGCPKDEKKKETPKTEEPKKEPEKK